MMDNCCAPQWADFMHSPQVLSDDYFEREHSVHEPQANLKCIKRSDLPTPRKDERSINETKFEDSLEEPSVNTAYFIPYDPKKATDDARKESKLRNLKLNEKSNKVHQAWSIPTTELTSTFKVSMAEDKNKPMLPERIRKRLMEPRKVQARQTKKDNLQAKRQTENHIPEERLSYKIGPENDLSKKRRSIGKYPRVLTCQYTRRSLTKYRRCSNKFVSLAEAVSKYQNGTPERFRTLSNKPGPLMRLKRAPIKLTLPISPALRCNKRTRRINTLSQEERDKLQIEELKKNPIRANPVPVNILKGPSVLKKVAKRPTTITEEFQLSQPKKKTTEDKDQRTANVAGNKDNMEPVSKRTRQTMHGDGQEKSNNKEQKNVSITRSTSSSNAIAQREICTDSPGKKTRHTVSHVSMQENKKEQKASGPTTRSISASNVTAKKENISTSSPVKKTRHTSLHVNTQENKKEQKSSAPVTRSTSASNVTLRKENICADPSVKKTHQITLQENKKEQKASAPVTRSTSGSNVTLRKENTCTDSSVKKTRQTILQGSNEKEKESGVPISRSTSASNIKKTNSTDSSLKKTRHTVLHRSMQETKEKKEVPIIRSVSASNIKKTNSTDSSAKKTRHTVLHRSMQETKEKKEVPIIRSVSALSIGRKNGDPPKCSFEARNKEFQAKKEEKLKSLQEMNKIKAEFHARPAPKFARTAFAVKEPKNKQVVAACPFSFEQRNKNLAKKKEELVKQKQEEETKTWVFHANPAPNFKPVTVHGWPRDKETKEPAKRAKNCNDQENRQPNVMINTDKNPETKTVNKLESKPLKGNADTDKNQKRMAKFELKTDKRAKDRTEFDEKLKKKEQEMAMKKLEEEKERLLREKMEIAELRKMTEIKARPMPVYKPLIAIKSTKPPTCPHSPALGVRNRAKSAS